MEQYHGTTILSVRRGNRVALGGDGQVTLGNVVAKGTARKVRRIYNGKVLVGFAGSTADAFSPARPFRGQAGETPGPADARCRGPRQDWRSDRALRRLEAMLIVADRDTTLVLTGNGDVLDPEGGVAAIGSAPTPSRRPRPRSRIPTAPGTSWRSRSPSPANSASTPTPFRHRDAGMSVGRPAPAITERIPCRKP